MKIFFKVLSAVLLLLSFSATAQPGLTEMEQARGFIRSSYFSIRDLSYVLAALIATGGSIHVYDKWQSGKDITRDLPAWFFSALFVLLLGSFLTALFGI